MRIEEIRTANVKELVDRHGYDELAEKTGRSKSQLSQWANTAKDSKTGKVLFISTRSCRMIEEKMGLPEGWMDRNHSLSDEKQEYAVSKKHREVPLYKRPSWDRMEDKGEPIGWFTCPIENCSEKTYALEVRDDAMLDHTGRDSVLKGDIVFIDENEPYRDGDMVLATSEEYKLVSIKKYIVQDSIGVLYTANPTWQRQFIRIDEGTVKIHGTVIAALRLRR